MRGLGAVCVVMLLGPGVPQADLLRAADALPDRARLILVEAAPWDEPLMRAAAALSANDERVGVQRRAGRSVTIGDVLDVMGDAGHVLLLDRGCVLAQDAWPILAAHPEAELLYADEDGAAGAFHKPAWSLDLALEQDLVGGLCLLRRGLLAAVPDLPLGPPHDIALHLAWRVRAVTHVPRILCHCAGPRRMQPGQDAVLAALAAVRPGPAVPCLVDSGLLPGRARVQWRSNGPAPLVSVVTPTRDRADLLARCAEGVLSGTDYPAIQLIIADNGSAVPSARALLRRLARDERVRVVAAPGPFNYAGINNLAVRQADGTVLVLLNDDIEVIDPAWLTELAGHAMRPEVGAVGAKLLYPDGTVQHAGIVLGVGTFEDGPGIAGHFGLGEAATARGYADQFATTRAVSAVTGACLATRRAVYDQVGGLDAVHLPVALNDVDYCLRVRAAGLGVVWTPFARLLHHESASRGSDRRPETAARFRAECRVMRDRWGAGLDADPFYNPNFSRFDHSFQSRRGST